ncbi:uncharacterized protein LOC129753047 [Uranotaenia lowii]|uniref:uncharacterized protein LOC129753047 n=1 Tax=Uranotaenia lowii TaxID=190385 RepID=UPI00247A4205|nr:uncharacterized protein LOC129753047 [Uranotaenia lowii]
MSKTAAKLADAMSRRDVIFAMVDAVEEFIAQYNGDRDHRQVPVRMETLDRLNLEFAEAQTDIERNDDQENKKSHLEERVQFEARYCEAKGFLLSTSPPADANQSSVCNATLLGSVPPSFHLRLPKIDLPKFNGDFSRWLSFRDTFSSMVHSNSDIPTVAKLQYLLQCLEGEARKPFESVDVEANNYGNAWSTLLKRYDNRKLLKRQLFKAIYDLPPVNRESPEDLHNLIDDFDRHVKAMAKLDEPVEHWDTPLLNLLSYKLDHVTLRAWEEKTSENDDVKYTQMIEFLHQRVRVLKTVMPAKLQQSEVAKSTGSKYTSKKMVANTVAAGAKSTFPSCVACKEKHLLFQCPRFESWPVHRRRELVASKRLCFNCFRSGHVAMKCVSKYTCRTCHERHHSLLHLPSSSKSSIQSIPQSIQLQAAQPQAVQPQAVQPSGLQSTAIEQPGTSAQHVSLSVQSSNSTVLLQTVALLIVDKHGNELPARALLDSASMCNFITKKLSNALDLRRKTVDIAVSGIGDSAKQIRCQLTATIRSRVSPFTTSLEFLVLKKPTACLPTVPVDFSQWGMPDVTLADPSFNIPADIDLVVGGEVYHEFYNGSKISLGDGLPVLVDTVEEKKCEELFITTTTRDSSGRFVVRLPLACDPQVTIGDSRAIAERRFHSLERRLYRDLQICEDYTKFIEEYIRLGHMTKVDDPVDDSYPHCYLPHHPVFKESSTSTKIRVVFDASCKTSSGFSINDMQLVGPVIQDDLLSIVLRFRKHPIALVADIEKMYRQVKLHPNDCVFQRILWRTDPQDPIRTYELQTVTYGFASAPFLATRALQQVAEEESDKYPVAAAIFKSDFYMDDCLTGANDIRSAIEFRRQATDLANSAGFPLKKWASNESAVLEGIPLEDLAVSPVHSLQDEQSVSTLGLVWETKTDVLRFRVQLPLPAAVLTKRKIMSYIAQIFDPLGLVGPIITVAKLFMQLLWSLKTEEGHTYEWDRPLPPQYQVDWKTFHGTLDTITTLKVPRFTSIAQATSIQLHFFSDASEKAYGSCCYMRSECAGTVRVCLLTSKSKVAPLTSHHSIARLELCGAVLSTTLYEKVSRALQVTADVYFWTDSTTVLHWLQSTPARWKTFVANRVSVIQNKTDIKSWKHVPGVSNPADALSRGISPTEISDHPLWWTGAPWLALPTKDWPQTELSSAKTVSIPEERTPVVSLAVSDQTEDFASRLFGLYSSFSKLRRTVAYCMRYLRAVKAVRRNERLEPFQYLESTDLKDTELALCRLAQKQHLSEEIASLTKSGRVSASSPLKYLRARLDPDGIIRLRGVLSNAHLPDHVKHPIVLLAKQPLASLLADYYHRTLLHAGPQLMLATIRQRFWVIGARDLAPRVYHQCHRCFRSKPKMIEQSVADLPTSRVAPRRPFAVCGVDYCGPVYIKSPVRNRGPTKAYIAIFVCFTTRAVHIELVSDLSTSAFIAALRRFAARRNTPHEIHSDNGTAFRGAHNELRRIHQMLKSDADGKKQILDWCAEAGIIWKFIPPRSPHFGGLWEAAVKSAKHHLLREIGQTNITYEDMTTLLTEVEMCLNSRPLIPIPTEPDDIEALTPGHFLVGGSLRAPPDEDVAEVPDNHLTHWKLTQKRFQRIWRRWYPEYLQQLQSRATKHQKPATVIQEGSMVVIHDDLLPPAQWPLGIVKKLHPGKDGVVRVVTLRTGKREDVRRCVNKLALLPMPDPPAEQ